jgi:hypothetical protein
MDKEELLQQLQGALDNEENAYIMNLTNEKIYNMKRRVLSDLQLEKEEEDDIMDKLADYIYIDEIPEFKNGCYIRWINLNNPDNLKLSSGSTICDIELREGGTYIICRNMYGRRKVCFQIKMDEHFVFRKLTDQEKVLLSVMNYLSK